jgi:hypothetical protein
MLPAIDWSDFHVKSGNVCLVVPCIEFVLFLDTTNDDWILDFYQRARAALGDRLTHYQAESMKGFKRLSERAEAMVPTWFTKPRQTKDVYTMVMSQDDPNENVTAHRFLLSIIRRPEEDVTPKVKAEWKGTYENEKTRWLPHPGSLLRMTLALDHPLADPAALGAWIFELALMKTGYAYTGHCGYALNFYDQAARTSLYNPAKSALASRVLRYPGLGFHGGAVQSKVLRYEPELTGFIPLIERANWLNLACDATLDRIGGRSGVRTALGDDLPISVHEMKNGVAIQAGPAPQIGDLANRDFIPLYRRVAKVLRPVRVAGLDGTGTGLLRPATNEWLNAFDVEYK